MVHIILVVTSQHPGKGGANPRFWCRFFLKVVKLTLNARRWKHVQNMEETVLTWLDHCSHRFELFALFVDGGKTRACIFLRV